MTETEVTATKAAQILGVTDKTLRLWTTQGKITARQISQTRLAYRLADVESLAAQREETKLHTGDEEETITLANLAEQFASALDRIAELERRIHDLELEKEQRDHQPVLFDIPSARRKRTPAQGATSHRTPELPDGAILASAFADRHQVNRRTFSDHLLYGIGPHKETVDHTAIPNPQRPRETIRYLTIEQQAAALDYWQRHGVAFSDPVFSEGPLSDLT